MFHFTFIGSIKKYQLSNRFPWIREDFVATIVSEKNLYSEFIWSIYPEGTSILGWWPSWPIKNSWPTVMLRFCRFFDFADSPILVISEAVSHGALDCLTPLWKTQTCRKRLFESIPTTGGDRGWNFEKKLWIKISWSNSWFWQNLVFSVFRPSWTIRTS